MNRLTDDLPCGVLLVGDGGRIEGANRTMAGVLGMPPEALLGTPVWDILGAGARMYFQTHLFPLLRLRGQIHEVHLSLRTAADAELPVLLNASRRESEEGPVNTFVVIPIERRSQFEDEILEARRAAQTASESRARFLSMLSHDIRSPLSAITMSADLLAQRAFGAVTEPQAAELERIAEASRYVLRLVADVLDFSRLEAGRVDVRPEAVPVPDAVAQALALVEGEAREGRVGLAPAAGSGTATTWADPDRLQQILVNLLGNAIKFTDAGGRVAVTWGEGGGTIAIRVVDTGPGIEPVRLASVFAPFVQEATGAASAGVGLGLAISRELAQAMGGEISVESTLGEGSTFTLSLPVAPPAAA